MNDSNQSQGSAENASDNVLSHYKFFLTFLQIFEEMQSELLQISRFDPLTHLSNREQFLDDLNRELARAARFNRKLAVLSVDIDFFKKVNDNAGREAGDLLLKEIAVRMKSAIRAEDFIARTGGDEFAIILSEINNPHDAGIVGHRIVDKMSKPFEVAGHTLVVGASIGIAFYPDAGNDALQLCKHADIALSTAKNLGRGNYQFFTDDMFEQHSEKLELESELHFAIERNEFFLVYQPRFDMQTQKMVGMEVLLRWRHPQRGVISPESFIPIAEETGLIIPIGKWVLQTACEQFAVWRKKYKKFSSVLAVNVSPRQFQNRNFINWVTHALEKNNIPPKLLELEITESAVMNYRGGIETNLFQLRNVGVQFSIDDFGTGYSSLTRLKELPIQAIKIDRSFVSDIDLTKADNVIIKSTLVLAKDMGLNVIAEGVETESQLRFLVNNECPQAQGYYYSKPLTVEQMDAFIKVHCNESVSS